MEVIMDIIVVVAFIILPMVCVAAMAYAVTMAVRVAMMQDSIRSDDHD